jgi:metallophosphoesterase (TIGR00282 family)
MIGDVVGDPGITALERRLHELIEVHSANFVIVNGENSASGFGLTAPLLERLLKAGADVVSTGNHVWEKREFWPVLDAENRVLRPMNYPAGNPGRGWVKLEKSSPFGPISWLALNLQGREFMTALDCPFKTFDSLEAGLKEEGGTKPLILVDFHAESSKEKEALAYYLDGRVSLFAGTHTHVQTADERILPKGTGFISDLGMTGAAGGVIGMDKKICIDRARNQVLYRMEVAASEGGGETMVQGIVAEINAETGKAVSIKRFSS